MPEIKCKVGDDYYDLTFSKSSIKDGTLFQGTLDLATPLDYELIVNDGNDLSSFEPSGTNEDIVCAIKDAIGDFELTQKAGFVD